MSKRKKRPGIVLPVVITVVAFLASVGLFMFMILDGSGEDANPVTKTVNREITKKAVETVIQKETGSNVTIKEVKEQMTEEDAEEFDEIINKYADDGILSEALDLYNSNNGDLKATGDALKDKVSPEDMDRLYELYGKYGDRYKE